MDQTSLWQGYPGVPGPMRKTVGRNTRGRTGFFVMKFTANGVCIPVKDTDVKWWTLGDDRRSNRFNMKCRTSIMTRLHRKIREYHETKKSKNRS